MDLELLSIPCEGAAVAASSSTPRKRDGTERRRVLCDAAIQVLAEQGSRGLTHQQVDRTAGVPDGTTSYYYRTRAALLQGVSNRIGEIDTGNLKSLTDVKTKSDKPFGRLARLVVAQADGEGLQLNKARLELLLAGTRDPAIAETSAQFYSSVVEMTQEAISALERGSANPVLREAQSSAIMTFIGGAFVRFAMGDRSLADADHIERVLHAIVSAVESAEEADVLTQKR